MVNLSPEQRDELLCTYAALILHDDGAEVTAEGIGQLVKGAGCQVEAYWPTLFAKMIQGVGCAPLLASGGGEAAGKAEEKQAVEEVEEEDEGMDFGLFD